MLACKSESMQLSALKARITALGAIGPPNIVDLPEFAPVFPTTAFFGWAFRCLERLECRAHLPGDSRTPSEGELFVLVSGKESPDSAARTRAGSRIKRTCQVNLHRMRAPQHLLSRSIARSPRHPFSRSIMRRCDRSLAPTRKGVRKIPQKVSCALKKVCLE